MRLHEAPEGATILIRANVLAKDGDDVRVGFPMPHMSDGREYGTAVLDGDIHGVQVAVRRWTADIAEADDWID